MKTLTLTQCSAEPDVMDGWMGSVIDRVRLLVDWREDGEKDKE